MNMLPFHQLLFVITGVQDDTNKGETVDVAMNQTLLLNINNLVIRVGSYTGKEWTFHNLLSQPIPFTLDALRTTLMNEFRQMKNHFLKSRRTTTATPSPSRIQRSVPEEDQEEEEEEEIEHIVETETEPDFGLWIHLGT